MINDVSTYMSVCVNVAVFVCAYACVSEEGPVVCRTGNTNAV